MKHCLAFCALLLGASLFAEFGAGEMKTPGRTWYVAVNGDDKNDGKTPETAWKNFEHGVKFLKAGDTLQFGEGVFFTGAKMDPTKLLPDDSSIRTDGKPGAPIRLKGAGRDKTILDGAIYYPLPKKVGADRMMTFQLKYPPRYGVVWEYPSGIKLQRVHHMNLVKEYPGTYYLAQDNKITVHFSAEDQKGIHASFDRIGLAIRASYVLVEGITFKHYREAIFAQQNVKITRQIRNITIRDCSFFYNYRAGILLNEANHSLLQGNQGMYNGTYGSFLLLKNCTDNLVTGNWAGPSPITSRERPVNDHQYGIQKYGGKEGKRNHYIGNVVDDALAFRWKSWADENSRFEDNIIKGRFYAESEIVPVTIQRNFFGGKVAWQRLGTDLWEKKFAGTPIVFRNNVRDMKDFKPENKNALEALKLAIPPQKIVFPWCHFKNAAIKHTGMDNVVFEFFTPRNDGWGAVTYSQKGVKKWKTVKSTRQGVRHVIGLSGLKPDTEYEYQLLFTGRRGEKARGKKMSFRTAKENRAPMTITVDPAKMSLEDAAQIASPGDTVILLPGRHFGQFTAVHSGKPGKVITLKGEKGAIIDGMQFYAPLINLSGKKHWVVEGIAFDHPGLTTRNGLVQADGSEDITVRNCRSCREFPFTLGPFVRGSGKRFLLENNMIFGGSYLYQLLGDDHVLRKNTFVNGTFFCIFAAKGNNITITDNIFYRPCVPEKTNPAILLQNLKGKIVSDRNCFYSPIKQHPAGGRIRNAQEKNLVDSKNLADWQKKTGLDKNSICADPLFENVKKGDFRLKPNSPAKGKGAVL